MNVKQKLISKQNAFYDSKNLMSFLHGFVIFMDLKL